MSRNFVAGFAHRPHRTACVHLYIMKGKNDMPHSEVTQIRTPSARTLLSRRLAVGRPYTGIRVMSRNFVANLVGNFVAHFDSAESAVEQLQFRSTQVATNCNFLQEVAGSCRIPFFEFVNTCPHSLGLNRLARASQGLRAIHNPLSTIHIFTPIPFPKLNTTN
jgi:hypothetical protein